MSYFTSRVGSSQRGKCINCNKTTSNFLEIVRYEGKLNQYQIGASIKLPVCDEHYDHVTKQREILIGYCKNINNLMK